MPVVCITKGKFRRQPYSLEFATGSFNGDIILWELTRFSGGESSIMKIKEFTLGYNLTPMEKLNDPRVQIQSLIFSSLWTHLGGINIITGTRSGDIYFVSLSVSEEFQNKDPDIRDHLHLV